MNKPTKKFLYAQALAKKGFRIFPLEVNGKKPLHEGWQQEAAADASPWARGEDYNIGVATGQGIVVIDVDMKNGVDGEANWKWFCEKMNIPESPVQVATASPVPGRHIKYTVPLDAKIPNSVGKIAAGVDVRGEGGYVVGIGSVIDGREYTKIGIWGKGGGQRLAMPQALIDACGRGRERVADDLRDIPEGGELDTEANIASGRAYLKVAPESVQGAGGDATAFAVAARLRDLGLSQEMSLEIMMEDGGWNERCSPPWSVSELSEKVKNAYRYAAGRIGADTAEAQFADDRDSEETEVRELSPLEQMNEQYAYVVIGSTGAVVEEYVDDDGRAQIQVYKTSAFHEVNIDKFYLDEKGKRTYWSRNWIVWPHRRTYKGLDFNPRYTGQQGRKFNQWRGFAYEPVPGMTLDEAKAGCNLFRRHLLYVVCNGQKPSYYWLINHFAHLIQCPWQKPETAVVLIGGKGVGKSLSFDVLGHLMPDNTIVTANLRMLVGQFNAHMETTLLFQMEEAFWSGNKTAEGQLKQLITGKTHLIERKGHEAYTVGNYARIYITSNDTWAIPASVDERRFAVFDVNDSKRGDKGYFDAIFGELEANNGDGYRALMTMLSRMEVDLTMVDEAPDTPALAEQKLASLNSVGKWMHEVLAEGHIGGWAAVYHNDGAWAKMDLTQCIYDWYRSHAKSQGFGYNKQPVDHRIFGRQLSAMLGGSLRKTRDRNTDGGFSNHYIFAELDECRKSFEKWLGHKIEW